MKIGYVGLGNMGAALARRLQLQYPLFVYDLNDAGVEGMVEKGSTACTSPSDVASQCDVILLCLPTSDHVRAAIFGENGLVAALKSGTLIVDQTTGDPIATRAMAADLGKRGVDLIDAPVSGGAQGAGRSDQNDAAISLKKSGKHVTNLLTTLSHYQLTIGAAVDSY